MTLDKLCEKFGLHTKLCSHLSSQCCPNNSESCFPPSDRWMIEPRTQIRCCAMDWQLTPSAGWSKLVKFHFGRTKKWTPPTSRILSKTQGKTTPFGDLGGSNFIGGQSQAKWKIASQNCFDKFTLEFTCAAF